MRPSIKLSEELLVRYEHDGVVVIPSCVDQETVAKALLAFHSSLQSSGCDVQNLAESATSLEALSSTGGSGGVLDIFYEPWKLQLNEDPRIVSAIQQIWSRTYARCEGLWSTPFGTFDPNKGFMYIDRVCFRVPDTISLSPSFSSSSLSSAAASSKKKKKKIKPLQRSLTPHLDCCPHRMFESEKEFPKWRPVQAFLCLTDCLNPDEGGFEACLGFHREFNDWAARRPWAVTPTKKIPPPCIGDFTPIRPKEDSDVISRMQHIPCRAGDLVVWDNRVVHSNSLHNHTSLPRQVLYIGLLPDVPRNRKYAIEQLRRYRMGILPSDQWVTQDEKSRQICSHEFSSLGRKLMAIEEWQL